MQGGKDALPYHQIIRNRCKSSLFNQLVKVVKLMAGELEKQGQIVEVRGLENPKGGNPNLYANVLGNEGVPLFQRHISHTELAGKHAEW